MSSKINVFWFRRDLRLDDNHGLFLALSEKLPVLPIFIFDTNIIKDLPRDDHRINLIYNRIKILNDYLKTHHNSMILIFKGKPEEVFKEISKKWQVYKVYANEEYEPYSLQRDKSIKQLLNENGIQFHPVKDHVIFSPTDIQTDTGKPYRIYTPFSKKWLYQFHSLSSIPHFPSEKFLNNLYLINTKEFPSLEYLGFKLSSLTYIPPEEDEIKSVIQNYHKTRNLFGDDKSTTRVSTALRFGFISIRKLVSLGKNNIVYLKELIWREFFQHLIYYFPTMIKENFRNIPIQVENDEKLFEKWKNAETGYPLIDAAMNQLNQTGYMHNRLRMLVANFLCKILWIDWRWGERYFAEKLFDFELASNVGNWQWSAGTGLDASPYFRIFNPELQLKKFDPQGIFLKKWLPYDPTKPPKKIVNFNERRNLYLNMLKKSIK
ncbi:cryptochrome/photolyase family protein [Candidatus Chrysopegis kryptomonas]|uniref:Deoxyribodipyrimidine photo-lyase n=1 Tax=Candidatus Chryseopegocella kryptomonas TaxID=1633643 RepID=A0A0P1MMM0_9BACT|nr:deoxyribodipyrimidine photo-lyase [Candidatus Chrysopegis kryptomonas]CUS96816.1 deoxyribodipyrimidine photo-lyase [Candidatus Chrysopegis kryptomonas]